MVSETARPIAGTLPNARHGLPADVCARASVQHAGRTGVLRVDLLLELGDLLLHDAQLAFEVRVLRARLLQVARAQVALGAHRVEEILACPGYKGVERRERASSCARVLGFCDNVG